MNPFDKAIKYKSRQKQFERRKKRLHRAIILFLTRIKYIDIVNPRYISMWDDDCALVILPDATGVLIKCPMSTSPEYRVVTTCNKNFNYYDTEYVYSLADGIIESYVKYGRMKE